MRKKTHAEYENELLEREIDFWPIEAYAGTGVPIMHECVSGHNWKVKPNSILSGIGCPYCSQRKHKTHEEYCQELLDKGISIAPVDNYVNTGTPITHICPEGHKWKAPPNGILDGKGCAVCAGLTTKTHEDYVKGIFIDATPIESYINARTPILHKCGRGHEWSATPNTILAGHGCKKCNLVGGYNNTRFSRDRELATSPGVLYTIVLVARKTNERVCVKVGITKGTSNKDVLRRAAAFKGYEPRIQKLVYGTLEEVFKLEQEIHAEFSQFHYTSEWSFGGHTELFEIEQLPNILKSIRAKG